MNLNGNRYDFRMHFCLVVVSKVLRSLVLKVLKIRALNLIFLTFIKLTDNDFVIHLEMLRFLKQLANLMKAYLVCKFNLLKLQITKIYKEMKQNLKIKYLYLIY